MCGLVGYVDFAGAPPNPSILRAMTARLSHRGPDAMNVLVEGICGLGHARLSVIDLAGSHQPMMFPDVPIALAFNGEIYNFRELRAGLLGEQDGFRTQGDTEVLLRALGRYWTGALGKLDGMFAFAAWSRERSLLLARDPFGKKPLYYTEPRPGLVVFGSEIKALVAHPEVAAEVDLDSLRQALRFRAVYGSSTLYKGIWQVEPGSWVEFSPTGRRDGRYFELRSEVDRHRDILESHGQDEIIECGRALLESAVHKRLVADVPVGAFLSGGLDSSLIVALMRSRRGEGQSLHTYSVGFRADSNSELPFAKLMADHLGTTHTEVHLDETEYQKLLEPMTQARDAPVSEPADLAIARMSAVARRSVTVVLSGEGSDEAFAGYPKYSLARTGRIPRALFRAGGYGVLRGLAPLLGERSRRMLIAARALAAPTELDSLAQWFSYLDRPTLTRLLPGLEWHDCHWEATNQSLRTALQRASGLSAIARMQVVDCLNWLPGNLLERGDRMTMSASLEMRCPFMDRQLMPFGLALDDCLKVRGRSLKWIVREWARSLLPPAILQRRKWGFRVPLAQWFRTGLRSFTRSTLLAPDGICGHFGDRAEIERLLEMHQSMRANAGLELWSLLAAEVWYQKCRPLAHMAARPSGG